MAQIAIWCKDKARMLRSATQRFLVISPTAAMTIAVGVLYFSPCLIPAQEKTPKATNDTETVYVGLIEDDRRQLAGLGVKDHGPVSNRTLTPAFEKNGAGWQSIQRLNEKVRWTIAFDGKNLGEVESEPIVASKVSSERMPGPSFPHSILTPTGRIPIIGTPDERFNGDFGAPVRRPLVVISKPNFKDPEEWKRARLPAQEVDQVRVAFRKIYNHLRQCDASGMPLTIDWQVPNSEIGIVKAYGSNKSFFLVETELKHTRCAYSLVGKNLQALKGNHWFYLAPSREASYLGNRWELVDAGDYDGDGKSEIIFYITEGPEEALDTEGYVLFYDDFHHNIRFTWNNH